MDNSAVYKKIHHTFFAETDPIRLDTFRVALGAAILCYFIYLTQGWRLAGEWLTEEGFHVPGSLLPSMPFMPLMPAPWLPWFGAFFLTSTVLWMLGLHAQKTGWLVFLCVCYVSLADVLANYSINWIFMLSLAVLCCAGQGKGSRSVWPVRILQLVLVLQYFMAGWSKAFYGDWLSDPLALWSQLRVDYMNEVAAWLTQTLPLPAWTGIQFAVLSFELLAPFLFFVKRLRPIAFVWGVAFQLGLALLMQDFIYFSLQMLCFYVLFVPDSTLHAFRRRLARA